MTAALRRWCRALLAGWDRWIATAIALNGTQTDPEHHTVPEQCNTPTPAGHAPGSATTKPTSPQPGKAGTYLPAAARSRYPHPSAVPDRATTYPSPL